MRAKLLVENFIFFGVLRVVSSALPFFILPIITSYLPNPKDFAIYDNYTIIVSVICSIAMMGSFDAMFREFFREDTFEYRSAIIKSGLVLVTGAVLILISIAFLFRHKLAILFFGDEVYTYVVSFVLLSVPIQTLNSLAISPSKMVNNRKHILYHTLLYAFVFYLLSLVLLMLDFGFISLIIGQLAAFFLCLIVFGSINFRYFARGIFDYDIAKTLLKIGLPLVPIFVIYWANNAIVRVFIVDFLGPVEMGAFALGSRYAAISSLLQAAFAGGWSYFTYSTLKDLDQVQMKSKVFKFLLFVICVFYWLVGLVYEPLFNYFFEGDYTRASEVFCALFLGPLLLILYQIVANQFTIIGKSYISLIALSIGLVANLIIGYYGTSMYGSLSIAAASIPLGYMLTLLVVLYLGHRYKIFLPDWRSVSTLFLLLTVFVMHHFSIDFLRLWTTFVLGVIMLINMDVIMEGATVGRRLISRKSV